MCIPDCPPVCMHVCACVRVCRQRTDGGGQMEECAVDRQFRGNTQYLFNTKEDEILINPPMGSDDIDQCLDGQVHLAPCTHPATLLPLLLHTMAYRHRRVLHRATCCMPTAVRRLHRPVSRLTTLCKRVWHPPPTAHRPPPPPTQPTNSYDSPGSKLLMYGCHGCVPLFSLLLRVRVNVNVCGRVMSGRERERKRRGEGVANEPAFCCLFACVCVELLSLMMYSPVC